MSLLDTVFEWVVATTIRASLVVLVILSIQLLLRPWLPAKWRHPLWLPLLLVMVMPFVPALPLHPIPARPSAALPPLLPSGETLATKAGDAAAAATINAVDPAPQERLPLLPSLWLAGVVVTLGAGLAGYRRKLAAIRSSAVSPAPGLRGEIETARQAAGLADPPVVWLSREVESPAVCGLWRPVLLLPAGFPAALTAAEARLILLHEFSHLKRHDLAQNWLLFALQALHWFNPLIWFAFARLRFDRETACDARVLALDAEDRRADYGRALLKMQELPAGCGSVSSGSSRASPVCGRGSPISPATTAVIRRGRSRAAGSSPRSTSSARPGRRSSSLKRRRGERSRHHTCGRSQAFGRPRPHREQDGCSDHARGELRGHLAGGGHRLSPPEKHGARCRANLRR